MGMSGVQDGNKAGSCDFVVSKSRQGKGLASHTRQNRPCQIILVLK